jgi:hypothetical protein
MHVLLAMIAATSTTTTDLHIAIVVEEVRGIDAARRDAFAADFETAVEETSGHAAVLDRGLWNDCGKGARCASAIRAGAGVSDVLFVRLFRAGARARFIAERVAKNDAVVNRVQMDLDYDALLRPATLEGLAGLIYEREEKALATQIAAPPPPPADTTWRIIGYGALGAGAVALGIGTAFRLSGDAAADRVESMPLAREELDDTRSRAQSHLTASNFLFGGAAALLSAGVVAVVLSDSSPAANAPRPRD